MSVEDQPQRTQNCAGIRWNPRRPLRPNRCGWCSAHTAALREISSRAARILPLPGPPAGDQRIVTNALLFVPEGPRWRLAGGKPAQRARPPVAPLNGACPSGASKKFLGVSSPQHFRHHPSPRVIFYDAPLGHRAARPGFRGRRPRARTCPRLISSGVPPGREPGIPARSAYAVPRSSEYSAAPLPLPAATGGRSRSASAAPLGIHRISVGHPNRLD